MASSNDDTLQSTDRWARAVCDTSPSEEHAGHPRERAARALLFGAAVTHGDQAGDAGGGSRQVPRIGKYLLGASLGRGGMGEVFVATDTQLGRKAAVKVLRPRSPDDPVEHSRLLREAQALATISDEHVVGIFDCGIHDAQVFLAMEYIEGRTLRAWQDAGPHGWREVLATYLAAGRGLAAIHAAGLVHRDFKPQNVLVGASGRVKIVDFGLAVAPGERVPRRPGGPERGGSEPLSLLADQLTATSAVLGTPLYISPEQLAARPLDARSDQFSFCVAFYEALYGSHPYAEPAPPIHDSQAATEARPSRGAVGAGPSGPPSVLSLVTGLVEGRLRKPRKIVVASRVFRALERGLSRDPADRYPSMDALLADLARDPLRKYGWWFAAGSLGAVLGGAGVVLPGMIHGCEQVEPEFTAAWDPARAEAVKAAFLATGSPQAQAAAERVDATLTQYRDGLIAGRIDNCEATRRRTTQTGEVSNRRAACLEHARDTLRATADQLLQADAAAVEGVADALALLPALETCDADFQRQQTCLDGADDPIMRGRLDRARALEISGRLAEAEAVATAVLADAGAHPRLAAEAQLLRGRVFAEQSRAPEASEAFSAAYALSERAGCEALAFEAATRTTKLVALNRDLPADSGPGWSLVAASKLQKLPDSPRLQADLHSDLGLLYQHREDLGGSRTEHLSRAGEEHRQALALRQRLAGDQPTLELAVTYMNLSVLARSTSPAQALELADRSLAIHTAVYRDHEDHPLLWKPHRTRGNALLELRRLPEARAALERAIGLVNASLGPGHAAVAHMQYALATTYAPDDREPGSGLVNLDEALRLGASALAIAGREVPEGDPLRIHLPVFLGQIHSDRDELDAALTYRQEAVRRQRHAGPEDQAHAHAELAETLQRLERPEEALRHLLLAQALLDQLDPKPEALVRFIADVEAKRPRS